MRMQEFKEGKIAVYAETTKEATRFLKACEEEGLRWRSGQAPLACNSGHADIEFAYNYDGIQGMAAAWWPEYGPNHGYHARNTTSINRPYKSVTVKEFFDGHEDDLSFEAFKQGKYAVTFKNPKRGDPDVEAFVKFCEAKSIPTTCATNRNLPVGMFVSRTIGLSGCGNYKTFKPSVPSTSVPWLRQPQREHITIYRTKDGRVECVHKVDGKEVGKASVTRYYKDEDNFLTAAKRVVEKLSSPLPPFDENGKPNYKVGQKVRMGKGYAHPKAFVGEIVAVEHDVLMTYRVREPDGAALWQYNRNVLGLAE